MQITVRLFARARDLAGADRVVLDLPAAGRVGDLRQRLSAQVPQLAGLAPNLLVALGNEYAGDDAPIAAGTDVACFPPVSGGESMIRLTTEPIDFAALTESVRSPQAGAVVLFLGTVREMTDGRVTVALDYEAYPQMAEATLTDLLAEARRQWPIVEAAIVHRLGHLELGDVSVAVAVSTPHREQAFEAGKYLIDRLKEIVPIWKKENWADGSTEWVHPGTATEPHPQGIAESTRGSVQQ